MIALGAGVEGRSVIVTGAGGGIGAAVAKAFADSDAHVVAVDRSMDGLDALRESIGGRHGFLAVDLTDLGAHEGVVAAAAKLAEPVGLVHCAAVLRRRSDVADVTEEDFDVQLDVNLKATFFLCRAFAEDRKAARRPARIVAFTSQGWWTGGFGGSVVYAATKGGIVSMVRGLARTYGSAGITVNAIAPGQARTPMLLDGLDPAVLEKMTADTPLGRIAEPEELAGIAVFLTSDHASFVTGAVVNATGGFLMY